MSLDELRLYVAAYSPVLMFLVIFLSFYFMIYRPQKAEKTRRDEMLRSLHKGNRVMTLGGIYGEIVSLDGNTLELKIAEKVVVKAARSAVSVNLSQGKSGQETPGPSERLVERQIEEQKES